LVEVGVRQEADHSVSLTETFAGACARTSV
jgi:hypothetical protein